jgi:hypothetical protein
MTDDTPPGPPLVEVLAGAQLAVNIDEHQQLVAFRMRRRLEVREAVVIVPFSLLDMVYEQVLKVRNAARLNGMIDIARENVK